MDVRDDNSPSIAICAALAAVDSVLRRALADIGAAELQVLSDGALSARLSQPRPLLWVADKDTWLRMSTHCPANQRSAPQRVLLLDTPSALNSLMAGDGALPVDLAMQLPVQQLEIETGLRTLLTLLRVEVRAGDSLNPPAVRTMPGTPALLASLIDASADAIIVANMHGRILLFNHSAERLYGYRARDVVGRMRVDRLYFGRQSIEIMHKLRAAAHGGSARLLEYPVQARCADGQPVPILLSASLVYEGDKVVASFGVARDLREQIRAERRLAKAKEKVAQSEKNALIAEFAGTAAHELNQPLMSVTGAAEILARRLEPGSAEYRAAQIIATEAERMAEIVRKIGRATRYETKSYVGNQRILDLDKASLADVQADDESSASSHIHDSVSAP